MNSLYYWYKFGTKNSAFRVRSGMKRSWNVKREKEMTGNETVDAVVKRGLERRTNRMGDATMRAILDAAKRILIEEGVSKFTIGHIAREAGVTKGTLLYHFHDKDQLLEHLMDEYVNHLEEKLEEGIATAKASGRYGENADETVAGFLEWYRQFRRQDAAYTAFGTTILAMSAANDAIRRRAEEWYESLFARLRASNCEDAVGIVLLLEGLFFLKHMRLDVTKDDEVEKLLDKVERLL